jgi:hypothetical protein
MFTWICDKCGAEVPPSYSECPRCAGEAAAPPAAEAAPAAEALAKTPAQPAAPAVPPSRFLGLPGWVLALLSALVFATVLAGGFVAYQEFQKRAAAPRQAPAFQPPSLPSPEAVKAHPMTRFIEITGLRLTEDHQQKASVQFVVVNHSSAEIGDLGASVNLKAVTVKGEQEPVGTFSFKIPSLGPDESKDLKVPLTTKLRVYELPDWQFLRADFQITSP